MDSLRPFLWLALAFVLFLLYQAWQQDHAPVVLPDVASSSMAPSSARTAVPTVALPGSPAAALAPQPTAVAAAATTANSGATATEPSSATHTGERITVRTDVLEVVFDTLGGDLVVADLLQYPVIKGEPALSNPNPSCPAGTRSH